MQIIEENEKYLVVLNGNILYTANNLAEAEGYIAWATRQDAGDSCASCSSNE